MEILEAMRNPYTGVGFLTTHQSFATLTFVSADAVTWLMEHIEGVNNVDLAVQVRFKIAGSYLYIINIYNKYLVF